MDMYCNKCKRETKTLFNDFMVAFCLTCKSVKHTGNADTMFTCRYCGNVYDKSSPSQSMCVLCERELWEDNLE